MMMIYRKDFLLADGGIFAIPFQVVFLNYAHYNAEKDKDPIISQT